MPYYVPQHNSNTDIDQEKTKLRTKLDDLSAFLVKLSSEFLRMESELGVVLLESQMANRLGYMGTQLLSLESLEGKEGETFTTFVKSITDIIKEVGILTNWRSANLNNENLSRMVSLLTNLEEQIKQFLPVVVIIDEKRKERNYETFGGMLQKFTDMLEEKKHLIVRNIKE